MSPSAPLSRPATPLPPDASPLDAALPPSVSGLTLGLYNESEWPLNFLMEMMFFMFDTIIAGPSAGASQDAKRNLEAAVPSGDIVSTARLYEQLFLAVKDPSGEKRMTFQDFYNDPTCVEEIHEGFVRLYLNSPEHRLLMVEVHAEFDDRRRGKEERCGR